MCLGYFRITMSDDANISLSIKHWAEDDRPREKLLIKGRSALSSAELIAILIGSGNKEDSAVDIAKKVLSLTNNNLTELGRLSVADLKKIKGIGEAKAITILAALELGRRRGTEDATDIIKISSSKDLFQFFFPLVSDLPHEAFWMLMLNRSNKIIGYKKISEGGIHATVVDSRIVFKHAIEALASSIIFCHNHPSGNLKPSEADLKLTQTLQKAGELLEIKVLDHIIIANNAYFSFADEMLL